VDRMPSLQRIAQKPVKNYAESVQYLDKFTLREVKQDFSRQAPPVPDSLEASMEAKGQHFPHIHNYSSNALKEYS